jgi:hypothetical protein
MVEIKWELRRDMGRNLLIVMDIRVEITLK